MIFCVLGCEQDLYVLFSLNVAILAFAYLFLDRFNHLMNQSKERNVVHPNGQYPLGTAGKPMKDQHEEKLEGKYTSEVNGNNYV